VSNNTANEAAPYIRYFEALAKSEQGDSSLLRQIGGIKKFKEQLAIWLYDKDQAIRAFAATMLGIIGDQAYAQHIAKLLMKKEQNPDDIIIYDRGRAALVLGILQAKEYDKHLLMLLSSNNKYDRAGAVQGLGFMGNKEYAKAVAQLLNDEDEDLRISAKHALQMLGAGELIKDKK
jgi:HEAT repeat protein